MGDPTVPSSPPVRRVLPHEPSASTAYSSTQSFSLSLAPSTSSGSSHGGSFLSTSTGSYSDHSLQPLFLPFLKRGSLMIFLCYLSMTPLLIPMQTAQKGDIHGNRGYLVILAFTSFWLWAPRFVFAYMEIGSPPIPNFVTRACAKLRLPDSILYYYRFWPIPVLCIFNTLFVVIIPSLANAFPVPFFGIVCSVVLSMPANYIVIFLLFPAKARTAEVWDKLRHVGNVLYVPFIYTLCGFAFLCGFYVTSGEVITQLVLVCVINFITFCIRMFMRRFLRRLQLLHFEGPIMFFVFSLSQYFTLQSLPTSAKIYVYIGSFIMRIFSGVWPLINWQRIYNPKGAKIASLEDGPKLSGSRELTREDSRIFGFFAHHLITNDDKEMEREALNSFVIMLSSILSCILFLPLFLFYTHGWSQHYFIYSGLHTSDEITLICYIFLTIGVTALTFMFTNQYFLFKYQIDSLRVGVEDFATNFAAYFTVTMYAIVVFVLFNLRQSDVINYVAKELYTS